MRQVTCNNAPVKATSKPYQIKEKWYYPQCHYHHHEIGLASWYGPGFHGKLTSLGDRFNAYGLTAAHKTLPLPSIVRVTNLENGRQIKVLINDRGPFISGRVIDLSMRAAQLLGTYQKGLAKVRIDVLVDESLMAAKSYRRTNPLSKTLLAHYLKPLAPIAPEIKPPVALAYHPGSSVSPPPSPGLPPIKPTSVLAIKKGAMKSGNIYIQAGAFSNQGNASRVALKLQSIAETSIMPTVSGAKKMYRVRIGPIENFHQADKLLETVISSGHRDAKIVTG